MCNTKYIEVRLSTVTAAECFYKFNDVFAKDDRVLFRWRNELRVTCKMLHTSIFKQFNLV
jgi:hypothetical protein